MRQFRLPDRRARLSQLRVELGEAFVAKELLYEQLLADDINHDGVMDSSHQEATIALTGNTTDDELFEGSDMLDLLLSGKNLRDLLEQLAAEGAI